MIIICFNLSNYIKYLIALVVEGFSGEWYINSLARFPLLKAAQNLEEYYHISKAHARVMKYLQHNPLDLRQDWGLFHQTHLERGDPSSSSDGRTPEPIHRSPCVEHFSYAPVVVQMVKYSSTRRDIYLRIQYFIRKKTPILKVKFNVVSSILRCILGVMSDIIWKEEVIFRFNYLPC